MNYEVTMAFPVYNAEKHLRESLLTALAQDYPSIEYLIVDDCSTDGSAGVVRQLQQEHPRGGDIRIVSQEHNSGVGAARNRALDEARGRFLYFMDADDKIVPTTISLMMEAGKSCDAQAVMASYERIELYQDRNNRIPYQLPHKVFTQDDELAAFAFHHYGALQANIWNILMSLELIRSCGLRFIETNFWEDMAFKYRFITRVARAVLLPDITYSYICRENTLSNFQARKTITKEEILRNVSTICSLKRDISRMKEKSYFKGWLNFMLKTDFFIIKNALKMRENITPPISDAELREILRSPISVTETLKHGGWRATVFKVFTILPPRLSMWVIGMMNKL